MSERCLTWDLPVDQCAHCRGDSLPRDVPVDWTTTNPVGPPPATPVPRRKVRVPRRSFSVPCLRDIDDLYERLLAELPALSRGRNDDNAAPYAGRQDPRRAPVRIEVHDLIAEIERELPDLARWVCDACGWVRCVVAPVDSDRGRVEDGDPQVGAAIETLSHYWRVLERYAEETLKAIEARIERLVRRAERLVGVTVAPRPLAARCPVCAEPSMFRVLGVDGEWLAVCSNPEDRDEDNRRRQWTETEWEDAHPRNLVRAAGVSNG